MKKMKGVVVPMESPYASYEDQRARLRHQSLLQDYEELQVETDDTRRKLEIMKQKKLTLLAEVRFLRQRYRYLMQNPQPKQDVSQLQKVKLKTHAQLQKAKTRAPNASKGRNYGKKDPASRPPPVPPYSNPKERTPNGVEVTLQKPAPVFDLNQNARISSGKDASLLHGSGPMLDLNQMDRIHSGKEATKKSITPFFDLNQISREEEEMQGNCVEPMKIEEPKKSTLRMLGDDEIKLSVCRNIGGDVPNRAGKRKITWQDQVALRV